MLKRLLNTFLFVLTASLTVAASSAQTAKTLMWKVTSGDRTLYLTGDTQLLLPGDYPLPVQVEQAFLQSAELVLEGDPGVDSGQVSALIKQYGLLTAPDTLNDTLSGSQASLVKRTFAEVGASIENVEPFRPWLAAIVLAQSQNANLGCDPQTQETIHFYKLAKSRGLVFTPLETAPEQLKLFAQLPQSLQVAWLMAIARAWPGTADEQHSKRQRIVQAWRRGDASVLEKSLTREFEGQPELYRALVTDRNSVWLKTLQARLAERGAPVFVVVGSGHLVGKDNLVSMLVRAGYQVTQL